MSKDQTLKFVFFPPSPWSERARWALEHSGIPYETIVYTPLMTTSKVRWLTRNFTKKVTIPVAIQGEQVLRDSFAIAHYANEHRLQDRQDIFPETRLKDIEAWNTMSERLLDRLRLRALPRMQEHRQAKLNNLPSYIPNAIKPYMLPVADVALTHMRKKYALPGEDLQAEVFALFNRLREALMRAGGDYLLGSFSYADITMAVTLQAVSPCDDRYVPLDSAIRECWTDPELQREFEDLVQWRDRIYSKHRLSGFGVDSSNPSPSRENYG